jgi:excisionase family DNA binding protein
MPDYSKQDELTAIKDAWSNLPPHVREAILVLVGARAKARAIATREKNKREKALKPAVTLAHIRGDNILATVPEVSAVLRLHRSTIYRLVEREKLSAVEIEGAIRIHWGSVEKLLNYE